MTGRSQAGREDEALGMEQEIHSIGTKEIAVWPAGQELKARGSEAKIYRTTFKDTADYHPGLIAAILRRAEEPRNKAQYSRSLGGTKLYYLDRWEDEEVRLINARALAFYREAVGSDQAVIDIAWANIYGKGDYIMPHSHTRAAASLVYCVDQGDPDELDPNGGLLCFVDPRFPDCCQIEREYCALFRGSSARGSEAKIYRTTFKDTADYHPGLIAAILRRAEEPRNKAQYSRSLGGTKLYYLDRWEDEEVRLINARALAFYREAVGSDQAVIDIAWANIYGKGDYIMPHSHTRAAASLVYCVDQGDPDELDPNGGLLCFVDPRFPDCCQIEPHHMTNPLKPTLVPGAMLLFPGQMVHFVTPYGGGRPRITLAWNINQQAIPGSPLEPFEGKT